MLPTAEPSVARLFARGFHGVAGPLVLWKRVGPDFGAASDFLLIKPKNMYIFIYKNNPEAIHFQSLSHGLIALSRGKFILRMFL